MGGKRYLPCRSAGPGLNRHCGDCARVCALGLGTAGTCRITHELQTCPAYVRKVKPQFEVKSPVVQVDHPPDLEGGVVGELDVLPSLPVNDSRPSSGTAAEPSRESFTPDAPTV